MEAVEPAGIGNQLAALGFENLPYGLVGELGMTMRLGVGDESVEQPQVLNRRRGVKKRSRTTPTWGRSASHVSPAYPGTCKRKGD